VKVAEMDKSEEKLRYLISIERYEQAEALLRDALQKEPANPVLLYCSALIDREQERFDEAEETLHALLSDNPEDEEAAFLLAIVCRDTQRYAEAERLIIELIHQYPDQAEYYAFYATIMLQTLHLEKVRPLTTEALRLDPENTVAQTVSILHGIIHTNRKEYQERLADLVRRSPTAYSTACMILLVLYEKRKHREALRIAQELFRSDPQDEHLLEVLKELRVLIHPALIPLWPMVKYGRHGSAVMYVFCIGALFMANQFLSHNASMAVATGCLLYIGYSYCAPLMVKGLLNKDS